MSSEIGTKRIYNNLFDSTERVVHWEVLSIKKEQEICIEFISTNSKYRQGIRLGVDVGDGYVEVNSIKSKGMQLWEDNCPQEIKIKCISSEGKISIYNIFDMGSERGGIKSQMDSCGMLVEEQGKCRIYRCNDVGFESDFDKLVFKIKLL